MDTFLKYIENKNQEDAIEGIINKLTYEKGVELEDIADMEIDDLIGLITDIKPELGHAEGWSDLRFAAMVKQIARSLADELDLSSDSR
jgi:hypothetical protein